MSVKIFYLFMRGLGYFVREFKTNILSLITIITLVLIYHTTVSISYSVKSFLSHISATDSVRVYLDIDIPYQIDELKSKIEQLGNVKEVKLYRPSDAKKYLLDNAPDIKAVNNFDEEFFPSFFLLTLTDNTTKDNIISLESKLSTLPNIDSVSYGKEYINRFFQINIFVTIFIVIFILLLIIAIVFVVYNTIRLSLYKYSEEIKIYNLVGATRPFIIIPYLISASIQMGFGYLIGTFIFALMFQLINSMMLSVSLSVFRPITFTYYLVSFLILLMIALLSSSVSVISYLKKVSIINES